MALNPTYSAGTVSVAAGGTTVTGSGTLWFAGGIREGDVIEIRGLTATIAEVVSNTSLTIARAWPGTAVSASGYEIRFTADASRVLGAARAVIERFENRPFDFDPSMDWTTLTNAGSITWDYGNGFRDEGYVPIHRFPGRAFFGAEANHSGNRFGANGYGDSPIAQRLASYVIKNAQMGVTHDSPNGRIGFVGASWIQPGQPGASSIGVAGIARHDGISGGSRGGYFEMIHTTTAPGITTTGAEVQVGNHSGREPVVSAYDMSQSVINGQQTAPESQDMYTTGNGDVLYTNGTHPAGAAHDISGGGTDAAWKKWTAGVVFRNGALKRDGSGNADAILMAQRHRIRWEAAAGVSGSAGVAGATITSHITNAPDNDQRLIFVNGGIDHRNATGLAIHSMTASSTAVNGIRLDGVNAGGGAFIRSQGSDAEVDINMRSKGSTSVVSLQRPSVTGLPTADPADGRSRLWMDPATRIVRVGT